MTTSTTPALSPLPALDAIRDDLAEAARYAATNPVEAERLVVQAVRRMDRKECRLPSASHRRILDNFTIGLHYLACDPSIFAGYALGARFELGVLRSKVERMERKGDDQS